MLFKKEGGREGEKLSFSEKERKKRESVLKEWGRLSRGASEIKGVSERDRWRAEWVRKRKHEQQMRRERGR